MRLSPSNTAALVLAAAFAVALGAAFRHRSSPDAGLHVALLVDVSGTQSPVARCGAARILAETALADTSVERHLDLWFTGTRRLSDGEPVHVLSLARARAPVVVELHAEAAEEDGPAEIEDRCAEAPSTSESPLFAALAAALDSLRPRGCGTAGVACRVLFVTDGIETADPGLMGRPSPADPRLHNEGIDVLLCGTSARVPVRGVRLPRRDDVEAAWRAEMVAPARLTVLPVCLPDLHPSLTE